jgi:hypothetical protein
MLSMQYHQTQIEQKLATIRQFVENQGGLKGMTHQVMDFVIESIFFVVPLLFSAVVYGVMSLFNFVKGRVEKEAEPQEEVSLELQSAEEDSKPQPEQESSEPQTEPSEPQQPSNDSDPQPVEEDKGTNPQLGNDSTGQDLESLASSSKWSQRIRAANSRNASTELLKKLTQDKSKKVREAAQNALKSADLTNGSSNGSSDDNFDKAVETEETYG